MLAGTLEDFTVEDVLRLLARTEATGTLRLNGRAAGLVHCTEGNVTFASAAGDKEMGPMLIRAGFLSAEEWTKVLADDTPASGLLSAVAGRGIAPDRLSSFAINQIEESVFELTRWQGGDFLFEPGGGHRLGQAFTCPMPALIDAIEKRRGRWTELSALVPSTDLTVCAVPALPDDDTEFVMTRSQWRVLRAVDGAATVADLARTVGQGIFHTCEVVAALVSQGLVELRDAGDACLASPSTSSTDDSVPDAIRGLLSALKDLEGAGAPGQAAARAKA